MEAKNNLVCVECGKEKAVQGQSPADELTCQSCGYEGPAYMFDAHELLE